MASIILDFMFDAGAAYLAYAISYAGFSWQILSNNSHGQRTAWEGLLAQLCGFVSSEGVLVCIEAKLVSLPYSTAAKDGNMLRAMITSSRKIRSAITRLEVLRNRPRMFAFGLLFASSLVFVKITPLLFGYSRWPDGLTYTSYAVASALFFGVVFNLPHAVLWSQLQDECEEIKRVKGGAKFEPVS